MTERDWRRGAEFCQPKVVDLLGLAELSKVILSPSADHFDQQMKMFSGSKRGTRPNNPEIIRGERSLREALANEMSDLVKFLAEIENNPRALMLIRHEEQIIKEHGKEIKKLVLSRNKDLKVKRGERKQLSILVLELITEKGGGPVQTERLSSDPAERLERAEEINLIRIRAYTRKVWISANDEITETPQVGIDVERVYSSELGYLLMVHYCFPNSRNVKASETSTEENPLFNEAINEAVKCIKRISKQRND